MKRLFIPVLVVIGHVRPGLQRREQELRLPGECLRFSAADKILELKNTQPELNPIPGESGGIQSG